MSDVFASGFAQNIFKQKYSMDGKESWSDTCKRVVDNVCADRLSSEDKEAILQIMVERKFIPGGRYLYSAGRPFHQVNNCLSGDTEIITKKGIFRLKDLAGKKVEILNRYGKWEQGEVRSFGQQYLYRMVLSNDTSVFATLGHRWFDVDGNEKTTQTIERIPFTKNQEHIELDEEGIRHGIVYGDGTVHLNHSHVCLIGENKQELISFFPDEEKTIEVGGGALRKYRTVRSVKTGHKAALQPVWYKNLPELNCSPEYARGFIAGLIATDGSTKTSSVTISCNKLTVANQIAKLATLGGCVVSKVRVAARVSPFDGSPRELCTISIKPFSAPLIRKDQIEDKLNTRPTKMWVDVVHKNAVGMEEVFCVTNTETGSFTLANGLTTGNCFLFRAEDSREDWAALMERCSSSLLTGGGIGVDYSNIRPKGAIIRRTGGECTGPIALMQIINEAGRHIMQGGQRRSAIWAGLNWSHKDIPEFLSVKDWPDEVRALKEKDFNFPAKLDGTNISVIYDTEFFIAINEEYIIAGK